MEELAVSCYGVEIRLVDAANAGVCERLRAVLAPEFGAPVGGDSDLVSYLISVGSGETAEEPEYQVTRDGEEVLTSAPEDELLWWLRQDFDTSVARRSRELLFVHAGVVGWRGLAILVPGRSNAGKSTLVAELVRRGAVYYSDEFAVLDEDGLVHPYRRPLVIGDERQSPSDLRLLRDDTAMAPLPIGLIVAGEYDPRVAWRPTIVRGARTVLPLIDGTALAREESERMLQLAARLAPTVVTLQGTRPDASGVAAQLLDLVDDALVSHALGLASNSSENLAADLGRVAELRLKAQNGRPTPPARQLLAARYVRLPDFLSPAEHQRLLEHALACEADFHESGIIGQHGEGAVNHEVRRSRTLWGDGLEEIWAEMFDHRLRQVLPAVRQELSVPWFPLGQIERQLTAHGSGGFFAPHIDTGDPQVASRRVSCVYYFYASPRRFSGGELKLYDTWTTPTGSTAAGTHTSLTPLDNSLVFFPSDAFHEVCPVYPESDAFADSRFAITIWFRQGDRPTQTDAHPS